MAAPLEYGSINDPDNLSKLRDGLRLNWRLWTIFQTELSLEEGSVPTGIRENMLSLCHFVDKHTVEALNEPTTEKVMTLIEVNRQIANGLLSSLQNTVTGTGSTEQDKQPINPSHEDTHQPLVSSIDRDV